MYYSASDKDDRQVKFPLQSEEEVGTAISDSCIDASLPESNGKELELEIDLVEEGEREHWTHGLDFVLSLVGYAVGVSNLWRFPYLCLRNGGGAFLIPFFFFLFLCGIPLFYLEVCLGQFSGISSMFVWKMCPMFKGIGYGMVIVSGFACIYYNAVLSWVIYYLVNSFRAELPWASCGHWWNTATCEDRRGGGNKTSSLVTSWLLSSLNSSSSLLDSFPFMTSGNDTNDINATKTIDQYLNLKESSNQTAMDAILKSSSFVMNKTSYHYTTCDNGLSLCLFEDGLKVKGKSAAEEFWQYNVLRKTDGLDDLGSLQLHSSLCLLAAWVLVCLCLIRGVKSLGKVVYVTALLPYVLLTIFLIRGLMLPGAIDGITFYVKPDFSQLKRFSVWIEACLQVFYSLGPAWGGLITMASFNKFDNNCFRDMMIASMADGLTSFYGGFVVFSVLGFMAHEANMSVNEIATEGPGLALVAYPEAISKLPLPQLWAILFFFMLLCLGLDSQFGMFETVIAGLIDAFPHLLRKKRTYLNFGLAFISFCISLPIATQGGIYVFTLLDWYVAAFCVMFISLLECIIIAWVYGLHQFCEDIHFMLGTYPNRFFQICWMFITPTIMLVAFLSTCITYALPVYDGYVFPMYANVIGFVISFIPLTPILVMAIYEVYKQKDGSCYQRLCQSLRPASDWGPSQRKYRVLYIQKQSRHQTKSTMTLIGSIFERRSRQSSVV